MRTARVGRVHVYGTWSVQDTPVECFIQVSFFSLYRVRRTRYFMCPVSPQALVPYRGKRGRSGWQFAEVAHLGCFIPADLLETHTRVSCRISVGVSENTETMRLLPQHSEGEDACPLDTVR